ncbi:hypothetical protein IAU60_001059 [Kwoniella sp. DSM 27419]
MEDIIPTLIIIGAVYLLVRWFTGSKSSPDTEGGIRGVTPAMVETVHSAFPNTPLPNIIYHLSRSRSVQATSEEILERGALPAPPPNFNIPASLLPVSVPSNAPAAAPANAPVKSPSGKPSSLIDRYNLSSRLSSSPRSPTREDKGKGKEGIPDTMEAALDPNATGSSPDIGHATSSPLAAGKGAWAESREKREMSLKERKEKVILEARRRMMEKQAKAAESSA